MLVKQFGLLFLVVLCLISTSAHAIDSRLVVTNEQNINDKWYRTLSDDTPKFSAVDRVVKKQYFSLLLFFENYQINEEKIVNITYDFKIENPK